MPRSEPFAVFSFVYVLISTNDKSLYVGFTNNLKRRLKEHNQGLNHATKTKLPWKLIYYEAHRHEDDAHCREKYLKTTSGRRALHRMIREQLNKEHDLSSKRSTTGYA